MYWIQNRMIEIYDIPLVFVEFRLLFYWSAGNILAPEVHWCPALPVQENILVQVHCSRYTLLWRILFLVVKSVGILVSYSMRKPREGLQVSSGSWGDNGTAHSITCNLVVSRVGLFPCCHPAKNQQSMVEKILLLKGTITCRIWVMSLP